MAFEFGKIGVRVYPRTEGFARSLDRQLAFLKRKKYEVTVVPDTRGFKQAVERAAATLRDVQVKVKPVVDKAGFADFERNLRDRTVNVGVDFDKASFDRQKNSLEGQGVHLDVQVNIARMKAALERAERAMRNRNVSISMDVNQERIEASLQAIMQRLRYYANGTNIPVGAEAKADFFRKVERLVEHIEDQTGTVEVDVNANADTGAARAAIAVLTRPQTVDIIAKVNAASFLAAKAALMSLAGLNIGDTIGTGIKKLLGNLDNFTAAVSVLAPVIGALTAVFLALSSNIFALGNSLASILPAFLAVPGIFTGMAVGAAGLIIPLLDIKDVLGDLQDRFDEVRQRMSQAFWAGAEQPIRNLVDNLLPAAADGMEKVSAAIGKQMGAVADTLTEVLGGGVLEEMFAPLLESIEIATPGLQDFIVALINIGKIGGTYLPALARWFNDISASFRNWSETADITGAIDKGIETTFSLWRALVNVVQIFGKLGDIAAESGAGGLAAFEAWTTKVNNALNDLVVRDTLRKYFTASHEAMEILDGAFAALGRTLVSFADTAAVMMTKSSEAVVSFMELVEGVFSNPALQAAIEGMFDGIAQAFEILVGYAEPIAGIFETLADAVGFLAPMIAQGLGEALTLLDPLFVAVMDAALALVPVLSDMMTVALQMVTDHILPLVEKLSEWIQKNPELATTILIAVAAVTGLLSVLAPLVMGFLGFIGTLGAALSALTPLGAAISGLVGGFASLLPAILGVVGIAAGVIAVFAAMWVSSEQFRNAIRDLITAFFNLVTPIVEAVLPGLKSMWDAFVELAKVVWDAITQIVAKAVELGAAILERLQPVAVFLGEVLGAAFDFLASIVTAVFETIKNVIQNAVGVITGIFDMFIGLISGNWSQFFDGLVRVAESMMGMTTSIIEGAFNLIKTIIQSSMELAKRLFQAGWDLIVSVVNQGMESVRNFVATGMERMGGAVSAGVENVLGFFRSLPGRITGALGDLGSLLVNSGASLMEGFASGIRNAVGKAVDAAKGAVEKVRDFFPFSPAKKGPFSGKGYTTYSGKAMISDWAEAARKQARLESVNLTAATGDVKASFEAQLSAPSPVQPSNANEPSGLGSAELASALADALNKVFKPLDQRTSAFIVRQGANAR